MIRGLQIAIRGAELSRRIGERIAVHEAKAAALDARLAERKGDLPFDVRPEDNFRTVSDLENERQQYHDRIVHLALLRDNVVPAETYLLNRRDLRAAELILASPAEGSEVGEEPFRDDHHTGEIQGLKLQMSGEEIRRLLDERIGGHQRRAAWWKTE